MISNNLFTWTNTQHAIPLSQQLEYFKEYQSKLAAVAGAGQAHSIITGALYIISAGASDFVQNYYINPFLYKTQTADQFSDRLVGIFRNTVSVSKPPRFVVANLLHAPIDETTLFN
jgi:hypothetical protein